MNMPKKDLINLIRSCGKTPGAAADILGTSRQRLYDHRETPEQLPFIMISKLAQFLQVNYVNIVGESCKLS